MNEHRELLQKWLRMLFYIQIASMVLVVINALTYLDSITVWVNRAITVATVWCLFQLNAVNPRYRTSAITKAGVLICGLLTLPTNTSGLGLSSSLMLVGSICSWVTAYQEYHAHSEVVAEADEKLAKKWNGLFALEIAVAIGTSIISIIGTTIMVVTGVLTDTITTVLIGASTVLGLSLEGLYLLYMKRTLKLLEN